MNFSKEINRIHNWLMSWVDDDGGIHGPVLHKYGRVMQPFTNIVPLIKLSNIEDTTWTQAVAVLAYIRLYKKTQNKEILGICKKLADRFLELQQADGSFIHARFEMDADPIRNKEKPLIHQAFPDIALLEMYELVKDKRYLESARANADFILERIFDKGRGLFLNFSGSRTHTSNMTSVAIEAFVKLFEITGDGKYLDVAKANGEWIVSEFNGQYVRYSDLPEKIEPLAFYNGITLQGIGDLYRITKEEKYLTLMKNVLKYLEDCIDPETKFFYYRLEGASEKKYPQYVAGAGIILWNIINSMKFGLSCPIDEQMQALASKVLSNGAMPSYIGYGEWKDFFPSPGWVAMAFLAFCEYSESIEFKQLPFEDAIMKDKNYEIIDEEKHMTLLEDGKIIWKAEKKSEIPEIDKIKEFYRTNVLVSRAMRVVLKSAARLNPKRYKPTKRYSA